MKTTKEKRLAEAEALRLWGELYSYTGDEIYEFYPENEEKHCFFCGTKQNITNTHRNDCIWKRALELVKEYGYEVDTASEIKIKIKCVEESLYIVAIGNLVAIRLWLMHHQIQDISIHYFRDKVHSSDHGVNECEYSSTGYCAYRDGDEYLRNFQSVLGLGSLVEELEKAVKIEEKKWQKHE